ncbi:UNVERIFIED_CONTAM: hypothetical protein K2H54_049965 [Gekko kuhli]
MTNKDSTTSAHQTTSLPTQLPLQLLDPHDWAEPPVIIDINQSPDVEEAEVIGTDILPIGLAHHIGLENLHTIEGS